MKTRDIKTRQVQRSIKTVDREKHLKQHVKTATIRTRAGLEILKPDAQTPEEKRSPSAGGYAEKKVEAVTGHIAYSMTAGMQMANRIKYASDRSRAASEDIVRENRINKETAEKPFDWEQRSAKQSAIKESRRHNNKKDSPQTAERNAQRRQTQNNTVGRAESFQRNQKGKNIPIGPSAGAHRAEGRTDTVYSKSGLSRKEIRKPHSTTKRKVIFYQEAGRQRFMRLFRRRQMEKSSRTAATAGKGVVRLSKQVAAGIKKVLAGTKMLWTLLASGSGAAVAVVMIVVVFGAALSTGGSTVTALPVSETVEAYTETITQHAIHYGIGDYVALIKAVMMQESSGNGTDPMQCSACPYNTQYPGGITDPEYSIDCGIHYLADCLNAAGVQSPMDLEHIKLALQGYNFGGGYITWALEHYGGYSKANVQEFADLQGGSYGDVNYVDNVLRYYPFAVFPAGMGSSDIVQAAASQIGNVGGAPYWSWYGFSSRVEWCACFVSWCADQCGYIERGIIPKFSYVPDGVAFFKERGQWQSGNYTPKPGDIIFFSWNGDGSSDHVGIVEKAEAGMVHTIEGNTSDSCARRSYVIGSYVILGYGTPAY